MKSVFLYNSEHRGYKGHPVHEEWAKNINAIFINDRDKLQIPNISRPIKSFFTAKKIPNDVDLVLCEGASQIFSGAIWKVKNKDKKLALIVSDPKWFYLKTMNPKLKNIYMNALSKYDLFIPTSPLMNSLIPKELPGRRSIVFPFADPRFFKYKADLNSKNIVFTGRIGLEKGTDILLEAHLKIIQDFPESRLYVLGFGKLKDKLENKKIKNVIFPGWIDNPEKYLEKSSIYMSLARIDPAGVAVLEAMSSGLVPVVSRGVGNSYIVEKINKNLVVSDQSEVQKIIKKLWTDKKFLKNASQKSIIIAKQYNKEKSINLFKKTIYKFIEKDL